MVGGIVDGDEGGGNEMHGVGSGLGHTSPAGVRVQWVAQGAITARPARRVGSKPQPGPLTLGLCAQHPGRCGYRGISVVVISCTVFLEIRRKHLISQLVSTSFLFRTVKAKSVFGLVKLSPLA